MPKVMIGCPTRDRGWILPRHIVSLIEMKVPDGVEVEYFYLPNDCTDNTLEVLDLYEMSYTYLTTGQEGYSRQSYRPSTYEHLAQIRNAYIEHFLASDADYLFSVDSDILVPENALETLLEDDKDIVSMILNNQPGNMPKPCHNVMREDASGSMVHILNWPIDALFPVDLTGACYLIKREVLASGVCYAGGPQGEDIPFCRLAKQKGFEIWCDSRLKPVHVMYPGVELIAGYTA